MENRTVAKEIKTRGKSRKAMRDDHMPLSKENFLIMGAGLVTIAAGYVAMLEGSVEGFLPLVAAPLLLVIGYCVLIPFGILYRKSMFSRTGKDPAGKSPEPA